HLLHAVHPRHSHTLRLKALPYAVRRHQDYVASFASLADLASGLPDSGMIRSSYEVVTETLLQGINAPTIIRPIDGRNIVLDLLRRRWEGFLRAAGMSTYALGRHGVVGYVTDGFIKENRVKVPGSARRPRQIVGYRARKGTEGRAIGRTFWHFAIEGRPMLHPIAAFRIVPHVLFSSDGQHIWSNSAVCSGRADANAGTGGTQSGGTARWASWTGSRMDRVCFACDSALSVKRSLRPKLSISSARFSRSRAAKSLARKAAA